MRFLFPPAYSPAWCGSAQRRDRENPCRYPPESRDCPSREAQIPAATAPADDILDQFTVASDILFTQGGTIANGKLYYTFGYPKGGYPLHILVFDLHKKNLCAHVDNLTDAFGREEIECCAVYQGQLLCNTCEGSIFALEVGLLPL